MTFVATLRICGIACRNLY